MEQSLYIVVELLKKTEINEKSRVRISNKNLIKFDFQTQKDANFWYKLVQITQF